MLTLFSSKHKTLFTPFVSARRPLHMYVCVPVMMSQKRSDPFAMFNKINVKADRGRSTASGISQGIKLINSLPGLGRGRRQSNSVERQFRIIHRISIRINAQKCQTGTKQDFALNGCVSVA